MKLKLLVFITLLLSLFSMAPAQPAAALNCANPTTSKEIVECGACSANSKNCSGNAATQTQTTLNRVINYMSIAIGFIAVLMIIVGGFKYITSAGDSNRVTSAKNTIIWAVVGLILVGLSQFLVKFVVRQTG